MANLDTSRFFRGYEMHDSTKCVYKYRSFAQARQIIQNKTLWFSTPKKLAEYDPNEFNVNMLEFNFEKFDEVLRQLLTKKFRVADEELIQDYIDGITNDHEFMLARAKGIFERMKSFSLVSSFSETNHEPSMWDRYGDSNKGVCLGFHFPIQLEQLSLVTLKVKYHPTFLKLEYKINGGEMDSENGHAFLHWMISKADCWRHEKEVRAIMLNSDERIPISTEGGFVLKYDFKLLNEVYFGINTTAEQIEELKELIYINDFPITRMGKMVPSNKSFAFDIIDMPYLLSDKAKEIKDFAFHNLATR